MARAFGDTPLTKNFHAPLQMMEEQVKRNTEMFRQAMQVFSPFLTPQPVKESRKADVSDIDDLKAQLRTLQTRLDSL
jgi:polyhydroxyalkanoate synthesis regulator protein